MIPTLPNFLVEVMHSFTISLVSCSWPTCISTLWAKLFAYSPPDASMAASTPPALTETKKWDVSASTSLHTTLTFYTVICMEKWSIREQDDDDILKWVSNWERRQGIPSFWQKYSTARTAERCGVSGCSFEEFSGATTGGELSKYFSCDDQAFWYLIY